MNTHYDTLRGLGASVIGFVAWGITHASVDRWLGTVAALLGICLVLLTIAEKLNQWRLRRLRARKRAAIRSRRRESGYLTGGMILLGMALLMSGCSTPREQPAVVRAAIPIERAAVSAIQSRARVSKVKTKVATAREAVTVLRQTALPAQWPAIEKIEVALDQGDALLAEELRENEIMTVSLHVARDALTDSLLERSRMVEELAEAERKAKAYTKLKLWIASLVAAVAVWLTWQFLPNFFGPYKGWALVGAGAGAFGLTMLFI